mmetsp:Transcript_22092/g.28584  ORF Transcript_22092/g.28584 Transcript_22092/m.28584 type:complete len:246 (-) Transcript_22092:167-904(-)
MPTTKTIDTTDVENGQDSAGLFQENFLELRESNRMLRTWMKALGFLAALTTLSSVGSIIVAVHLSRLVSVDTSTGSLLVQGSSARVATVATGAEHILTMVVPSEDDSDDSPYTCILASEVEDMWASTMAGTPTNLVLETKGQDGNTSSTQGVGLIASGSTRNSTHVCFMTSDGYENCASNLIGNKCEIEQSRRDLWRSKSSNWHSRFPVVQGNRPSVDYSFLFVKTKGKCIGCDSDSGRYDQFSS